MLFLIDYIFFEQGMLFLVAWWYNIIIYWMHSVCIQ